MGKTNGISGTVKAVSTAYGEDIPAIWSESLCWELGLEFFEESNSFLSGGV